MIHPHKDINLDEVQKFAANAHEWWNEMGPYQPLHKLNIIRISYLKDLLIQHFKQKKGPTPLKNLEILDIGCGGGLVAEPLCRLGAHVTGIDPSPENIMVAKEHASLFGLDILYSACSVEELKDNKTYQIVLALEVLEHTPNPAQFIAAMAEKVAPGGLCIVATLNRTWRSYLQGIVAAEHILQWVPKGTHNWSKFLKPAELYHHFMNSGFQEVSCQGLTFSPLKNDWFLSDTLEVNYMAYAVK